MMEWTCTACRRRWYGRALTACPACQAPRPQVPAPAAVVQPLRKHTERLPQEAQRCAR